jgi:hypothetical protein
LIEGIGLFTVEPIKAGTVIRRPHPAMDIRLTAGQIAESASACREQAQKCSYRRKHSGLCVLCGDEIRFFKQSSSPNRPNIYNSPDEDLAVAA